MWYPTLVYQNLAASQQQKAEISAPVNILTNLLKQKY